MALKCKTTADYELKFCLKEVIESFTRDFSGKIRKTMEIYKGNRCLGSEPIPDPLNVNQWCYSTIFNFSKVRGKKKFMYCSCLFFYFQTHHKPPCIDTITVKKHPKNFYVNGHSCPRRKLPPSLDVMKLSSKRTQGSDVLLQLVPFLLL